MKRITKKQKIEAWEKLLERVKSVNFGRTSWCQDEGLCHSLLKCGLSTVQKKYVFNKVEKVPKMEPPKNTAYCWEPGDKAPRIKWINEQIEKLQPVGARKKKNK